MNSKELLEMNLKKSWRSYEIFLIFIIILESIMMVYGIMLFDFHDIKRRLYFSCYIFLFCFSLIALFINRFCMKNAKNMNLAIKNACIYSAVLIFWSSIISALDIIAGGYAVTYMTILAAIGGVVAFSPLFYTSVALLSSACMITLASRMGNTVLSFPFYLNHVIFLMVMIAVEFRNYHSTREQYMLNMKLEEWAEIDALTRVANRRSLDNYIEQLLKESRSFSFVLLDVDNFKSINDTYGHSEGDKCLLHIADILTEIFGKNVFRYGGDEFAVISFENADTVLEKMILINQQLAGHKSEYALQICAGVYYHADHQSGNKIFEFADSALYNAKQHGKARAVIYEHS